MKTETRQHKRVRTGDKIKVISGDDKGFVGVVQSRTDDKVVVRGVNICKKHVKKSELNPQGGVVQIERPIHISNVAICVDEEKPRKLHVKTDKSGDKSLVYRDGKKEVIYRSVKKKAE